MACRRRTNSKWDDRNLQGEVAHSGTNWQVLRHRPALEHTVSFRSEVEVVRSGMVLLEDVPASGAASYSVLGFDCVHGGRSLASRVGQWEQGILERRRSTSSDEYRKAFPCLRNRSSPPTRRCISSQVPMPSALRVASLFIQFPPSSKAESVALGEGEGRRGAAGFFVCISALPGCPTVRACLNLKGTGSDSWLPADVRDHRASRTRSPNGRSGR